jgi:ABC-2 type transport system permease protein
MKFWKIWKGWLKLGIAAEMAYRLNFLMKGFAMVTFDSFGPLLAILVYSVSKGIPGWSFEELLLMQAIFILTNGLTHFMFWGFAGRTINLVQDGLYDRELVRPGNPLLMALATGSDMDGFPRVITGSVIATYALIKLGWIFNPVNLFYFIVLIISAVMFFLSLQIIIAALAFLFVKSYTMMNIFDSLSDMGKNPLTVFGPMGTVLLTFVFPIGLAAFYPASALLGRLAPLNVLMLFLIGLTFFGLSAGLWAIGIKKYSSAGG